MNSTDNKDQLEMLVDYFIQLTSKYLSNKYEIKRFNEIVLKFEENFKSVISKYSDTKKKHSINPAFLMALNKAQNINKKELLNQMMDIYGNMMQPILQPQKAQYMSTKNPWKAFKEATKKANQLNYENEFFQYKTVIDNNEEYGFDLNHCVYVEIFNENNCADIAPLLCHYDFIFSENIKNWVTFKRKETIADGDQRCTFRYHKVDQINYYS